jgi:hypothetical protein
MSKCFIVTTGEYSDYSIEAVFTKEDSANEYSSNLPGSRVEEQELDPKYSICTEKRWSVYIRLNSGEVLCIVKHKEVVCDGEPEEQLRLRTWIDSDPTSICCMDRMTCYDSLSGIVKAKSEEHARRHVEEIRRQILAGQLPSGVENVDSYQRCLAITNQQR